MVNTSIICLSNPFQKIKLPLFTPLKKAFSKAKIKINLICEDLFSLSKESYTLYKEKAKICVKHKSIQSLCKDTPKKVYFTCNNYKSNNQLNATLLKFKLDNLNSIKELLGHSSLASTQVYTHSSLAELKNVYKNSHPRNQNNS